MLLNVSLNKSIQETIDDALLSIDGAAATARNKYITTTPGQAEVYAAKALDAQAYRAAGYPTDASDYIWIVGESLATGMTGQETADAILAKRDAWNGKSADIESTRMLGKNAIREQTSIAEILKIRDACISALLVA